MRAVITYHSIDPSGSVISIHPDRFAHHVEVLANGDLPVVDLPRLLQPECHRGVALTFDDAFENLAEIGWPILRDAGLTATVFVPTDWVGKKNSWDEKDPRIPSLQLVDWDTLQELASGGLRVESHGRSHRRLTSLTQDEVTEELEGSRQALRDRLGVESSIFCYPYGDVDARVEAAVGKAGYRAAVTTELAPLSDQAHRPFATPRLDAYYLSRAGALERLETPAFGRYLQLRRVARKIRESIRPGTAP